MSITMDWHSSRGRCPGCKSTFTPLPLLSLQYHTYSVLTRSQGIAAALCEALLLGRGRTYVSKTLTVLPDPSTLRRWAHGLEPFSTGTFLSPPNARPRGSLAGTRRSRRSPSGVFVLANSGSAKFSGPCVSEKSSLPTILAWECCPPSPMLTSRGKTAPWARTSKN